MDLDNFVTCQKCFKVLDSYNLGELNHAKSVSYHCKECNYSINIFSITKSRIEEMNKENKT